jgi:hypothetical protein
VTNLNKDKGMNTDEVNKALRLVNEELSYNEIIAESRHLAKEARKKRFIRLAKIKKRQKIKKDMRGELF